MTEEDFEEFYAAMSSTYKIYGKTPDDAAIDLTFNALANYDLGTIKKAIGAHLRDTQSGQYLPKPADILRQIELSNKAGWPGAEEAWARVPKSESESGMLFEEMGRAWSVAQPLYDQGDAIGARMTFKEAYEREVSAAKNEGRQPNWFFSPGFDKEGRAQAIHKAQSEGLISDQRASALLVDHAPKSDTDESVKQLVHQVESDPENAEKAIEEMRQNLGGSH